MITIYFLERKLVILPKPESSNQVNSNTIVFKDQPLKDFVLNFDHRKEFDLAIVYSDNPEDVLKEITVNFKFIEAAGGVVSNNQNEILIIERLGKNDLPKGKVEKNEYVEEGARREILEECGISNLELIGELKPTYHTYWLKEKLILKKTWWFNYSYSGNETLVPQTEENIVSAKWIKPEYLRVIKQNTYSSVIEVLEQINF